MGGTERSQIFLVGDGRNGTLADFLEGDGRKGTLADFSEGAGRNRTLRFFRSDEWLLGRVVAVMLLRVVE
jgi:hypothetical protein